MKSTTSKAELKTFQDTNGKFYQAYKKRPKGIISQLVDLKYYRVEPVPQENGSVMAIHHLVCEDCWKDIPKYVDFPRGLVSPESDGDRAGNFAKHRQVAPPHELQNKDAMATEALQKAVCLKCYLKAFQRFYPGIKPPKLRADVYQVKDIGKIEQPVTEVEFAGEPRA